MEVPARHELDPVLEQVLLHPRGHLEVLLALAQAELLIKIEAPRVQLPRLRDAPRVPTPS